MQNLKAENIKLQVNLKQSENWKLEIGMEQKISVFDCKLNSVTRDKKSSKIYWWRRLTWHTSLPLCARERPSRVTRTL